MFFKPRPEILVHNSGNWDFTKIQNSLTEKERERVKKASISMPLLFPDKFINQANLSRKHSGVVYFYNPSLLAVDMEEKAGTWR